MAMGWAKTVVRTRGQEGTLASGGRGKWSMGVKGDGGEHDLDNEVSRLTMASDNANGERKRKDR